VLKWPAAYQPNGAAPVSSSAIAISKGEALKPDWKPAPFPVPRALETSEISGVVNKYAAAARNSLAAGIEDIDHISILIIQTLCDRALHMHVQMTA